MAERPAYFVDTQNKSLTTKELFNFKWHPGLSIQQKQKCIYEFHTSILQVHPNAKILEISTKSSNPLGKALSAFNLSFYPANFHKKITVETAFQSSKVFLHGGPYIDLLDKTSLDAKKDPRLKNSGQLQYFIYFNERWELNPPTSFYDWIYINAIMQNPHLVKNIIQYNCFTDIEFNPNKSINSQAKSAALFVSLYIKNKLSNTELSKNTFLDIITMKKVKISYSTTKQGSLI